ncbi:nSTAND1 domain-containing NTPase [Actinophytocola sediminis]
MGSDLQAQFIDRLNQLLAQAGDPTLAELEAKDKKWLVEQTVSSMLNGNLKQPPKWDRIRAFVIACVEIGQSKKLRMPQQDHLLKQWRDDHAFLTRAFGQAASSSRAARVDPRIDLCPYPGLASFTFEQHEWFFGRNAALDHLAGKVADAAEGTGLVVLRAPSGAGKSSLLRAGLLPHLKDRVPRDDAKLWQHLLLTPTARPCSTLAARLLDRTGAAPTQRAERLRAECRLAKRMLAKPVSLTDALRAALTPPHTRMVIVVDQFEEVFTLCKDEHERRAFIQALCLAADGTSAQSPPALVVLGLRADFDGRCAAYPELLTAMQDSQMIIGPMTYYELTAAVLGPAKAVGLTVEPGLVKTILSDLYRDAVTGDDVPSYDPRRLPLLAHALRTTCDNRDHNTLTHAGYHNGGRINSAIATTAETIYLSCNKAQQDAIRYVLLQMIKVGDGTEDTRRIVERESLINEAPDPDASFTVLKDLINKRLVVAGKDALDRNTVEVIHEALIRAWPRLAGWITADRSGLLTGQQLREAAEAWERDGEDDAGLYRGGRLATAREWEQRLIRPTEIPPLVQRFLAASIQHEQDEQAAARRRVRRLRQLVAGLTTVLVVAIVASIGVLVSARAAFKLRDVETSRQAAGAATREHRNDPPLATQISLAAYRISPTIEARGSLLSLAADTFAVPLTGHTNIIEKVAYSSDGRVVASSGKDGSVRLWGAADPHSPTGPRVLLDKAGIVWSLAFGHGRSSRLLAAGTEDGLVRLWDITDLNQPQKQAEFPGHTGAVFAIAFSPDGHLMATVGGDQTIQLWNVSDPHRPSRVRTLSPRSGNVLAVAFSPDGRTMASGGDDCLVRLWDVSTPQATHALDTVDGHTGAVRSLVFSQDGRTLASGSFDTTARLWDVTDPANATELSVLGGVTSLPVPSVAFSPDGRTLATGSWDSVLRLWDVTNPREPFVMTSHPGHTSGISSVHFSPDGQTVVTGSADHTIRLWDMPPPLIAAHPAPIFFVALDPSRRILATASADHTASLWEVTNSNRMRRLATLRDHDDEVQAVAFSPDGNLLATASTDRTVKLWNITNHSDPKVLITLTSAVSLTSVAFSPDGRTVAAGGSDATIELWDVTDPTDPARLSPITGVGDFVNTLAISENSSGRMILVSGNADDTARLWDVTDPRDPRTLDVIRTGHDVVPVVFSPDARILAVAGTGREATLWDTSDPTELALIGKIPDQLRGTMSIAFSPDGKTLASGGLDGSIHLWDLTDPRNPSSLGTLVGHREVAEWIRFRDDHTLISGSADGTARLWEIDPERAATRICHNIRHDITQAEWDTYFPGLSYQPPC